MAWDYFVSYTQADRAWAEWIAWQLEESGLRVLVQAWDFVAGDNWVERMDQGVREAARTIAVLSPNYLGSVYGKAEWLAAWREDPLGEERKLVPFRVRSCERPGLLASVVITDLFDLPEAVARDRLQATIGKVQTGRGKPSSEPSYPGSARAVRSRPRFPGALPDVWNVPARNPNFTGRASDLDRLRDGLRQASTVAVCAVRGMGGVGKTQLAIEYAHQHATEYDLVWWITAENPATIAGQLARLATKLGVPADTPAEAAAEAALDHLRRTGRWLLIYDNAEEPSQVRDLLPSGPGRVLITTRRGGYSALAHAVDLDILDRADAVALLRLRLPAITAPQASTLADLLGDLPLALEQSAAYLRTTGLPIDDYLEVLRTRLADVADRGSVAARQETLATLWNLSYQRLADTQPAAMQLLQLCAWLAPENIPLDLFAKHPDLLPAPLREVVTDPLNLADAVGALVDYSLVKRNDHAITLHRLVQLTTRNHAVRAASEVELANPLVTVLELLSDEFNEDVFNRPQDWPRWALLLPHLLVAVGHHDDDDPVAAGNVSNLLDSAGLYLKIQGQPGRAETLLRRALAIDEMTLGLNHPSVAIALNGLTDVLRDLGRSAEALPLARRAVAIGEGVDEPDQAILITSLVYLAGVLGDLGRFAEALPLAERAVAIDEAEVGLDHPNIATDLTYLVPVLRDLGRAAEALPLAERAVAIHEAVYGPDHLVVATDLIHLVMVVRSLDRHTEALPLAERALAIREVAYGPEHPLVGTALNALVDVLRDLGRSAEALPLARRALAIHAAAHAPSHPDVASDLRRLADVLRDLGRSAEALTLEERAEGLR